MENLNCYGGRLVFGVANDDVLVGLSDAEGDAEKISEIIKTHLNPIPEFKLSFEKDKDKTFVIVEVMKGQQTPCYYEGDIEPRNWNYYTMYIRSVIHGVMQEMGYSEEQIGQYFKMSGDTTVTKTHGRKSVGGINRMVMDAQYFGKKLEKEAKYQWELSEYLNRDICQPEGFDAYGYPSELFKLDMERLGIAAKREQAKVIDFAQYIENNRGTND